MQTFLPYPNFSLSAQALDNKRLGKQRLEAWQILEVLRQKRELGFNMDVGWLTHPAVRMWEGYEPALCEYGLAICGEWQRRAFESTIHTRLEARYRELGRLVLNRDLPYWFGDERLHSSHRAALLFKNPEFYGTKNWSELPVINYWWPIQEKSNGA